LIEGKRCLFADFVSVDYVKSSFSKAEIDSPDSCKK